MKAAGICALILLWLGKSTSVAQITSYARNVVDTLSSPHMAGRGYVNDGDAKAAHFIAAEFGSLGLQPFGDGYFQRFSMPVNVFPGEVSLSVNGKTLRPGEDFLIDACSPPVSGSFETIYPELSAFDPDNEKKLRKLLARAENKFLIIDETEVAEKKTLQSISGLLKTSQANFAGVVLLTEQKLTWTVSTWQCQTPTATVKKSSVYGRVHRVEIAVGSKFLPDYQTQNVAGYVGGSAYPDSIIVFTAHYDHLGMMGQNAWFPGANDNASGVAMLLALARHYASSQPEFTVAFIAFGGEEAGLLGSAHFIERPLFPLDKIKMLVNIDLAGTGDEGITVVNGAVYGDMFKTLETLNDRYDLLPQVKARGEACNSDHCLFHRKGIRSFFIYTMGGIQAYHDIFDKRETLPLTEFEDYFTLLTRFTEKLMNP